MPMPGVWTPGISTGPLKVMTVLRFHSSANTPPARAAPSTVTQHAVFAALNSFIMFFSFLIGSPSVAGSACLAGLSRASLSAVGAPLDEHELCLLFSKRIRFGHVGADDLSRSRGHIWSAHEARVHPTRMPTGTSPPRNNVPAAPGWF